MGKDIIQNKTATAIGNDILLICECKTIHLVGCLTIRQVLVDSIGSTRLVISHIRAVCISLEKDAELIVEESIADAEPEFVVIGRVILCIVVALRQHIKMQVAGRFS